MYLAKSEWGFADHIITKNGMAEVMAIQEGGSGQIAVRSTWSGAAHPGYVGEMKWIHPEIPKMKRYQTSYPGIYWMRGSAIELIEIEETNESGLHLLKEDSAW